MRKVVYLFPGQGSQYIGMGKSLFEQHSVARETFLEADEVLGYSLTKLCFESEAGELQKTEYTQPAILTHSVAAYRVFQQEHGLTPSFMAGHSLGEITALVCAGSISFSDAVQIVSKRGRFMQEASNLGTGGMSAINDVSSEIVAQVCKQVSGEDEQVYISNYNTPTQTVISGHLGALERAERLLKDAGANVIRLRVSAPFHCPLMKEARYRLEDELQRYRFAEMKVPVISNTDALPYSGSKDILHHLTQQMTQPIQWSSTLKFLGNQGANIFIEFGPGSVLRNMVRKTIVDVFSFSYDKEEDHLPLFELLDSQKLHYPCFISRCLAIAVCTPNFNDDAKAYEEGVVQPYRRIQGMLHEIEEKNETPTMEQKRAALKMLESVFETKKTPQAERTERFRQLMRETDSRELFKGYERDLLEAGKL